MRNSGVPQDTASAISSALNKYSQISNEDLEKEENEDLRKEVLRQHYKISTSFSAEEIEDLIEEKVGSGKDVVEAKKGVKAINTFLETRKREEIETAKQQEKQENESRKSYSDKLNKIVTETEEIIPGVKIGKETKQKVIDSITKEYKTINGTPVNFITAKRMEDPEAFDFKIAYAVLSGLLDKKWDKPLQPAKNEAINDLNKAIKTSITSSGFKPGKDAPKEEDEKARDDFDVILDAGRKKKYKDYV
jgi:hypothetical protein